MEYALIDCLLLNHVIDKTSRPEVNIFGSIKKQEKWDEKNVRVVVKLRAMYSFEI